MYRQFQNRRTVRAEFAMQGEEKFYYDNTINYDIINKKELLSNVEKVL